jgi:toxin ParE1/3/4
MANRPRKTPQAEIDVTSIWAYIASDSIKAADVLIDRIERTFDMLAETPLAGRARRDLAKNLRSFPVGSYLIFYIPVPDGIEVVRVMSGRQDIDAGDIGS